LNSKQNDSKANATESTIKGESYLKCKFELNRGLRIKGHIQKANKISLPLESLLDNIEKTKHKKTTANINGAGYKSGTISLCKVNAL
jgi:hypothetical protein